MPTKMGIHKLKFFEPTLPAYYSKLLSDISKDKDVNSSIIFSSPES